MTGQRLAVGTALALAGPTAAAHGAFGDAGAFYSGLVHPFMVPAHLLTLLAFGLLVGQQAALGARRPLFVEVTFAGHCAGIGVGIALGLSGVLSVELPAATLMLVAVVAGVAVAGARALPAP
ncbi:MAG: HupE/UreJ family protein, partial [Ectothiorhodospiraceae bacterium]|nr:HupE/UreJ family protein [Ectothiorhodospiraceae bacterium]